MKIVTRYETEDGMSFGTEEGALDHERELRCKAAYEHRKLCINPYSGAAVSWENVSRWLDNNRELVADYLGLH